jgi:hypothetical protein
MRIHKTSRLIKFGLYAAIIGCAAGAATGTLAWYSYQKDVRLSWTGTTIKADKEIQVGLRTSSPNLDFEELYQLGEIEPEYNVQFDPTNPNSPKFTIYWIKGTYVSDVLHSFQEMVVHSAVDKIKAITSGKYTAGSPESFGNTDPNYTGWTGFKEQPNNSYRSHEHGGFISKTNYSNYFYCPLVFRAISEEKDENGNAQYLPNEKIFLSEFITKDIDAEENDTIRVDKAIRCKVDYPSHNDTSSNFIFDPNADTEVNLEVGGRLNLQDDIYYDYEYYSKKQIAYGQWEKLIYFTDPVTDDPTLHYNQCTTFEANDFKGGIAIDTVQSEPSVCQTLAGSDIIEDQDEFENGHGIAITDSGNNYGYVDLSIYLEGWDHNVVNVTAGRTFQVDLQFSLQ